MALELESVGLFCLNLSRLRPNSYFTPSCIYFLCLIKLIPFSPIDSNFRSLTKSNWRQIATVCKARLDATLSLVFFCFSLSLCTLSALPRCWRIRCLRGWEVFKSSSLLLKSDRDELIKRTSVCTCHILSGSITEHLFAYLACGDIIYHLIWYYFLTLCSIVGRKRPSLVPGQCNPLAKFSSVLSPFNLYKAAHLDTNR